jgi:hypothetical protein
MSRKQLIVHIATDDSRAPGVNRQGATEVRAYLRPLTYDPVATLEIEAFLTRRADGKDVARVRVRHGSTIIHDWGSDAED